MVLVEEVREDILAAERDSDYETDSNISSAASSVFGDGVDYTDDFDPASETLGDRLRALKDIVPPLTRARAVERLQETKGWATWGWQKTTGALWIVATSALLVGLPLALAIEDEARIVAQEREMQMQSQGQQQMLGGQPAQQQGVLPPGF